MGYRRVETAALWVAGIQRYDYEWKVLAGPWGFARDRSGFQDYETLRNGVVALFGEWCSLAKVCEI